MAGLGKALPDQPGKKKGGGNKGGKKHADPEEDEEDEEDPDVRLPSANLFFPSFPSRTSRRAPRASVTRAHLKRRRASRRSSRRLPLSHSCPTHRASPDRQGFEKHHAKIVGLVLWFSSGITKYFCFFFHNVFSQKKSLSGSREPSFVV